MVKEVVHKNDQKPWSVGSLHTSLFMLALIVSSLPLLLAAVEDSSESKTAHACEDGLLVLKCQIGEVIRILRANYGRFTISVCNHHGQTDGWNLHCMLPKAKDIISERCDGRHECEMRISNHVFGDPCPSTSKYAEVGYTCHLATPETPHFKTTMTTTVPIQPQMPLTTSMLSNAVQLYGSPRPPNITSATALDSSRIEVMWTQAEPPNPIVSTAVYYKKIAMEAKPSFKFASVVGSHIIDKLEPNTTYVIFLKSFNIHGPSTTSNTVNATTLPTEGNDIKSASDRADWANPGLFDASTKLPLHSTSTGGTTIPATSTVQSKTQVAELPPSYTDPPVNNFFPLIPEVHVGEGDNDDDGGGGNEYEDDENVNGVVDKFCEQRNYKGVAWPQTRIGKTVERNCPDGLRGLVRWRCLDYGWEKPGPDFLDCTSAWLEKMDTKISKVMRGEEPADEAAVSLNEVMAGQQFTSGDVRKLSLKLLPKLAKGFQRDDPEAPKLTKIHKMKKFTKAFMSTSSDLLSKRNIQSWRNLSQQDRRRAATSLFLSIEDVGFHASQLMDTGSSEMTVDENIVMAVTVVDTQETHTDIIFPSRDDLWQSNWEADAGSDSITIKSTSLKIIGMKGPVNIVFTLYKNMENMMQPQSNAIASMPTVLSTNEGESYYSTETIRDTSSTTGSGSVRMINSKVIAASINSTKPRRKLAEPVLFTLQHLEPISNERPLCSFWDMDTSYFSGQWSQEGCRLIDTNISHTTCECDHLTNFAVLMDVTGVKLSAENELALRVITFVGCIISVICLLLSWITFLVFKNLQCDRNTIHKNLVFCLLLAEIVFLGGIAQTEPKILCSVIAGLLHYLFLSAFAWMCLEGVQLYIMLVEVFEQEKSRVHWYYLFGYGVPAVVVAVSAGVFHEGYGTDRHCWLTTENYFIWSFVGPALAVMLINIAMLSIAVYTMCHHSIMSVTMRDRSKATKFSVMENLSNMKTFASPKLRFPDLPSWVKGAVVLVVLLGLTWILGVLYLNEESVVIAYFFTVLNSLQGLFIYVFHCIKNEKVQKEYRKVVRRTSWLPDCIRVNYGGYSGMVSNSQVGSSDSRNYLSKLFGQRKNEHSTASTNSSARPFLSKAQQRKSDAEHSTSKDSSNIPSSLNGYVYDPSYSVNGNGKANSPFTGSIRSDCVHGEADGSYEVVDDMAVDLSEYMDCSVVDSEFLSEYCQQNLQVCREDGISSTSSKGGHKETPVYPCLDSSKKEMGTISGLADTRKLSSCLPGNPAIPARPSPGDLNTNIENHPRKDPVERQLNLRQYVIPSSRSNCSSNKEINNTSELPQNTDNVNARMCTTSRPYPSTTSIPDTETPSPNSSSPNPELRRDFSQSTSGSSATDSSEENYMAEPSCEPVYEEVQVPASMSTLPNMDPDGLLRDQSSAMYGHPSYVISSRC